MLNRILSLFGLMTIKDAETIVIEIAALRERAIVEDIKKDFGKSPLPGFEQYIRTWALNAFCTARLNITKGKDRLVSDVEYSELIK
jgi:hypothetical protein